MHFSVFSKNKMHFSDQRIEKDQGKEEKRDEKLKKQGK